MVKFEFIKMGTHNIKVVPNKIILDVGTALKTGLIDHHHLDNPTCTTKLLIENPEYISDWIKIGSKDYTIGLHEIPDLDCICSAYLAVKYIETGSFPAGHKLLADYTFKIEQGIIDRPDVENPRIYEIMEILREKYRDDHDKVKMGFELLDYVFAKLQGNLDNKNLEGLFKGEHPFITEVNELAMDKPKYEEDLKDSQKIIPISINLPHKRTKEPLLKDGLIYYNPQATHFKLWARTDTENSPQRKGFIFLFVIWENSWGEDHHKDRYVISVDPNSNVDLAKLGCILNHYEEEALGNYKIPIEELRFKEYNLRDPWYDGRGHNFTIVDTPRRGTELKQEEIKQYLFSFMDLHTFLYEMKPPQAVCQLVFQIPFTGYKIAFQKEMIVLLEQQGWSLLIDRAASLSPAFRQFLFGGDYYKRQLLLFEKKRKLTHKKKSLPWVQRMILALYSQGVAILSLEMVLDMDSLKGLYTWNSAMRSFNHLKNFSGMYFDDIMQELNILPKKHFNVEEGRIAFYFWFIKFKDAHVSRDKNFYNNLLAAFIAAKNAPKVLTQSDVDAINNNIGLGEFGKIIINSQGSFLFLNSSDIMMPEIEMELVEYEYKHSCWYAMLNAVVQKVTMDSLIGELAKSWGESFESHKLKRTLQKLREKSINLSTRSINHNLASNALANGLWQKFVHTLNLSERKKTLKESINELADYIRTQRQRKFDSILLGFSLAIIPLSLLADYLGSILTKTFKTNFPTFFSILGISYLGFIIIFGITFLFIRFWPKK